MAAVAGAVADELIAFYRRPGIARAWVNNGGDIALHLTTGTDVRVGLFADLARLDLPALAAAGGVLELDGTFEVNASEPVRGVATSGWRGRSLSRGIADSVTVLASSAAVADAAATMIANAVDVPDPAIRRLPANQYRDDTDLGEIAVTVEVPQLPLAQVERALDAGLAHARALQRVGVVHAVALACQGRYRTLAPAG